jgi:hypothetical protein
MDIDKFADITVTNEDGMIILEFKVKHSIPTPLQWIIAINELKQQLVFLEEANINFGFLFDIQKIGLISLNYMKEFTEIMSSNSKLLEEKLYASGAIAQGSIIKYIFEAVNRFYKTKKPLNILATREEAIKFIKSNTF